MAQVVVCDGCENTVDYMTAMQVRSANIEEGSIQIDLCQDCSVPVRELPAFQKEKARIAQEMKDREVQAAQMQLEQAQSTGGDNRSE